MAMYYKIRDDRVEISIRLTPNASKNAINGLYTDVNGHEFLKVSVMAPPEDYKANAALIELLAKKLGIPKSQFDIIKGITFRNKVIVLEGVGDSVRDTLEKLSVLKP